MRRFGDLPDEAAARWGDREALAFRTRSTEVESYMMTHPGVRQVAVVSYPDARLGEVAVAFVQKAYFAGPDV